MMAQIRCEKLCIGYDGSELLHDLCFSVSSGDYLCIIGENGAGKSTLMKNLLGLLEPMSGKIAYCDGLTRSQIGYLPQQTVVQKDFPATVREIVLSGNQGRRGIKPFYSREDKQRAEDNMERMGITELAGRSYRTLSGGQQQRVLLARALCATSSMLLLDEPVSGLDPKATEEMYGLIADLNRDGITVIMITHDIPAAEKYASHILRLGEECFFGTRAEYQARKGGRA